LIDEIYLVEKRGLQMQLHEQKRTCPHVSAVKSYKAQITGTQSNTYWMLGILLQQYFV
jgi:hypothetical protein